MRGVVVLLALTLTACSHGTTVVTGAPLRLTPPEVPLGMTRAIVELDIPNWQDVVCVRSFPAEPQRYTCFDAGSLRQLAQPTRRAD